MPRLPRRRHGRRRGAVLLLTLIFFGFLGLGSLFGLHLIAVSTAAHSRLTETAQAAAYAAASAIVDPSAGGAGAGVILIDEAGAQARARAVIDANLQGKFGLTPQALDSIQIEVNNVAFNPIEARALIDPNTCEALPGIGIGGRLAWRDDFGDCHLTSGVTVSLTITLRACLFSGYAERTCPPLVLRGRGFADYAFRSDER
ncbi:hypothetical protein [Miltoncostaea oceani]|uniref:hypothetical protein n=1 Tax=Miltoncostaea oceani TaxID=2843216 RepID=UPI001C3DE338|nr:hypothetical protein [Miltoncostaea oceani]